LSTENNNKADWHDDGVGWGEDEVDWQKDGMGDEPAWQVDEMYEQCHHAGDEDADREDHDTGKHITSTTVAVAFALLLSFL
jgi:hypothetical protein